MELRSLEEFTAALAARKAVPGGGGAAALAGALAAALGGMVSAYSLGRQNDAAAEEDVAVMNREAEQLRLALLAGIVRDGAAFAGFSQAYALPRASAERAAAVEKCLRAATEPPLTLARLCCDTVALLERLAPVANPSLRADLAVGAALARAALEAAAVTVRANTSLMKDRAYAAPLEREVDARAEEYGARAERVYRAVYEQYCG